MLITIKHGSNTNLGGRSSVIILYNVIYTSWTNSPFIWLYSVEGPSKIIHLKYLHRNKAIGFVSKMVRAQRQVNSCNGS